MFNKLKLAYVAVFYKLCMFAITFTKRVMLHLINFQKLDPNRDVAAEQHKALVEDLSRAFSVDSKKDVSKIPFDIAHGRYDVKHKAFKIKHPFAYDAIPDFSNIDSNPYQPGSNPWLSESLQVAKAPIVEIVEVVPEAIPVIEVVEEVAEENILEVVDIVKEDVKPVKTRKQRRVKAPVKKLVKKPVKKMIKKNLKK